MAASNPFLRIPLILISGAWLISALNINFPYVVNVVVESLMTVGRWLLTAVDDFFEGIPIARIVSAMIFLYLCIIALSGFCYVSCGLVASIIYRSSRHIRTSLFWCCERRRTILPSVQPTLVIDMDGPSKESIAMKELDPGRPSPVNAIPKSSIVQCDNIGSVETLAPIPMSDTDGPQ